MRSSESPSSQGMENVVKGFTASGAQYDARGAAAPCGCSLLHCLVAGCCSAALQPYSCDLISILQRLFCLVDLAPCMDRAGAPCSLAGLAGHCCSVPGGAVMTS